MPASDIDEDLLRRIRSEFLEMPGLRLTERQAQRLWGLDDDTCAAVLAALVDNGFLFRTREGAVMRVDRPAALRSSVRVREASVA